MSNLVITTTLSDKCRVRRSAHILAAVAGCVLLSACAEDKFAQQHSALLSLEERHPIKIEQHPVAMELPISPGTRRLSGGQLGQVASFLSDYKSKGQGSLVVRVPSGTRNESAARSAANDIRLVAAQQGIAPGMVRYQPYREKTKGALPPVVLSYNATVAVGPECGIWPESVTVNPENRPYTDYGCSTQHNLAAMISNPNDLVQARAMTPRSAARNDTVYVKYVKGSSTSSQQDTGQTGTGSGVAE